MRAGKPSLTARWLAADRTRLDRTRPSTPGGDIEAERRLYRDLGGRVALPFGRRAATAARTRFVDDEVARAIGQGIDQVVLLGAGYDGRSLRFGGGGTRWFEVDDPDTQADKRRRLAALGAEPGPVAYVGLDQRRGDLAAALDAGGHDPGRPSLFIGEGLFTHLTLEDAASLCRTVHVRAAAGSVLAAGFLVAPEVAAAGKALRQATDLFLHFASETPRHRFRPGDPEKLMVVTGWRVVRTQVTAPSRVDQGTLALLMACEPGPPL